MFCVLVLCILQQNAIYQTLTGYTTEYTKYVVVFFFYYFNKKLDIKYWFVAKNDVLMHFHICIYFLNSLYHQLTWVHITVYSRSSDQTWLFCFYYFIYTTINALQFILNIKILLQINRVLTKKKSSTEFVSIKSKYSFL